MSFETAQRQPSRHALVLGATGAYGAHVTAALVAKGWTITALNRNPEAARRKAGVNMPIDWVTGDAMVAADVEAAARGARLIVHAVNPPRYRNWAGTVMPMLEATIVAAKSHGARILLPGTVYNYAPDSGPLIAEDAVQAPVTRKGAIRARMEARLREASAQGVTSLIMRAGDFFGPATENSALTWMVIKQRGRARAVLSPGPADVGHTFAYLPDLARATAMVLEREVELAQFETFHFGGHWLTSISLRDAVRATEDRPRLPSLPFPAMILRAMAPFDETMREMLEMQYLWHRPIGLDNRKLAAFLGAEPRTPLETAIRATLADVADGQAEPCVRRSDSRGIGFAPATSAP